MVNIMVSDFKEVQPHENLVGIAKLNHFAAAISSAVK